MKFTEDSVFIAPTPINLADEFAQWFFAQATENILSKGSFYVAISGGNTPILFFNKLAEKFSLLIDWTKVHIFWVDEVCVASSSSESHYKTAYSNLINKIDIPDKNVHRIKGEKSPDEEVIEYSKTIESIVPIKDNFPSFDVILLGMGDDGHTASIFPGNSDVLKSNNLCEKVFVENKKQTRITLTPNCINNSKKVAFQITGMAKSNIVHQILFKNGNCKEFPAAHINPVSQQLYWFLDSGATKGLFFSSGK